jgi:hypothetical protein
MGDFDREIERELDRVLRPFAGAPIPAWRVPASPRMVKKVVGGASAAVAAKLATGFAVAALAAAGAGVVTEATITGSLNPADWGQQVKHQVATCKAALSTADHGIGDCVSSFASQRGAAASGQNGAGGAGQGKTKSNNGNNTTTNNNQHQGQRGPVKKGLEHPPWVRD